MNSFEPIIEIGAGGRIMVNLMLDNGYSIYNATNGLIPADETSNTRFNYTIHVHVGAPPLVNPVLPHDTTYEEFPCEDELTVFVVDEVTGKTKGKKKVEMPVKSTVE